MKLRFRKLAVASLLGLFCLCCKPFSVKPSVESRPHAAAGSRAELDGLIIRGSAVRDEDWLIDTFDANLILAGVLPVNVEVSNTGRTTIDASRVKLSLNAGNSRFTSASPDRAFKRAIAYYGIAAWSKELYKISLADFRSHGLDAATPIAAGQSRRGLVFFLMTEELARQKGLKLAVSGLKLDDLKKINSVELTLE